jgi:hypothetical protein
MSAVSMALHVLSEPNIDMRHRNKLKNACALGLYFTCGDNSSIEHQLIKLLCASSAALMGYESIDMVADYLCLPRL